MRERLESARKYNQWINQQERSAKEDPEVFSLAFTRYVHIQCRVLREHLLEEFGVGFEYPDDYIFGHPYIVQERFPLGFQRSAIDYERYLELRTFLDMLFWFDGARGALATGIKEAENKGKSRSESVVEEVLRYLRMGPWMASPTERESDPLIRESYAHVLAGWVGAWISLNKNKRLDSILREDLERGNSTSERLIDELVPATILAFGDLGPREPIVPDRGKRSLVSRVQNVLEKLGSQEARLSRRRKLSEEPPDEQASSSSREEDDIENFEEREITLQRRRQLGLLVEKANLSEREFEVFELDMKTDSDTERIANKLNIDQVTVRGLRKRYTDKLKEVAKA